MGAVIFIWFVLHSQLALAKLADKCLLGVLPCTQTKLLVNDHQDTFSAHIKADKAAANYPEHALFGGNVEIEQCNNTLTADEVQIIQCQEQNQAPLFTIIATGNVNYVNNEIKLQGSRAWSNLNNKDTDVYQGNYQMVGRQGHGSADVMKQRAHNRYTILENGSFTSCLPADNSWRVFCSKLIYDREEQFAEIWNARFKIGKMLVFYSPYLQIPVGDKRRSGFLITNAKYRSSNGFELRAPYYLNLAPNYDATVTLSYMNKRDIRIQTEFRYLTIPGEGIMDFDWLPNSRVYSNYYSDRWLFYWHHNGVLNQRYRFNVDYTKVSDSNYFDDLDSKYSNITKEYATQNFSFGYADKHWDTVLSYKQFQVFNTRNIAAYRVVPQFDMIYYKNDMGLFDLKVFSQVAKFTNVNKDYPKATRLHIAPTLNLPLSNRWGSINTEAKLMATHYKQENIDYHNKNTTTDLHLKSSVNRVLPQFKTDINIALERNMHDTLDHKQTFESRLQYLYVPYRNQNNIGVYDSTIIHHTNYSSLFHDFIYSGLDRFSFANQLASGVTTRIYGDQLVERLNSSVGQIYYFSRLRSGDMTSTWNHHNNSSSVVWAGDCYWCINNQWGVSGSLQYNSHLNNVALGDAVLEYWRDKNRILKLNYRYVSPQYIDHMMSDISHPGYKNGISQLGVTGRWSLADRWLLVGSYYYDTKANQPSDQLFGLQYNTSCWAINIGYEKKIIGWNNIDSSSRYENKILFNLELRGLSNNYGLSTDKILRSSMIPCQREW
ncbi:LPS assembly protein LptD [Sodalis endosymbiont of Henestaris halophilus]|uniref:LPS assembly protein LptD n=1 Tax=Sodalis endosymbiont of Henestaris halophilus TaxID=1929246 RepID=UPI000BE3DA3D|nr:LPS assembly protein LptD [Sodalis endosymbiont of Henestaris halophilus]